MKTNLDNFRLPVRARAVTLTLGLALAPLLAACGEDATTAGTPRERAIAEVKTYVSTNLDALVVAAKAIQTAAPSPDADGWDATRDAAAVQSMRQAWRQARVAYERVEGAVAVLFPELDVATDARFPSPVEVAAYYVVSEALTNAAKHADASYASVSLTEQDGVIHLSVRDDGVGGADPGGGSGLIGLRDRVEALGGTVEIKSPQGTGTTLLVTLPVNGSRGT